jgi:hypothetical protein
MRQHAVIQTGLSLISPPRQYGVHAATINFRREPGCTPNGEEKATMSMYRVRPAACFFRRRRFAVGLAAFLALSPSGAGLARAADGESGNVWSVAVTPYLWAASLDANTRVSGFPEDVETNREGFFQLENLDFAASAVIEARKGPWSVLLDLTYVGFSDDSARSGPLQFAAELETDGLIAQAAITHTLVANDRWSLDLLGGLRYARVTTDLTVAAGRNVGQSFSGQADVFDPIVGLKGRLSLGGDWFIAYYGDIGGFGVSSDLTWQAYAALGYAFSWGNLQIGYRHLDYDFKESSFIFDGSASGPILGISFQF